MIFTLFSSVKPKLLLSLFKKIIGDKINVKQVQINGASALEFFWHVYLLKLKA